jgi:hypothetical protein
MRAPDDLARVKQAAEEASWLLSRGYPTEAVASFVSTQRALTDDEQRLLACSARCAANVKHHIARELDAEDVRKRRLEIDADSLLSCLVSADADALLLASGAGLICDPTWRRGEAAFGSEHASALARACAQIASLGANECCFWVAPNWSDALSAALAPLTKKKPRADVKVGEVTTELAGAAFVVSCDPMVLDRARSWVNLLLLMAPDVPRLTLE